MPEQRDAAGKGGTMRLGAYPCRITGPDTRAFQAYGRQDISERHRHRYEFNNDFRGLLTEKGLVLSGLSPDGRLVEMVEAARAPLVRGRAIPPGVQVPPQQGPTLSSGRSSPRQRPSAAGSNVPPLSGRNTRTIIPPAVPVVCTGPLRAFYQQSL